MVQDGGRQAEVSAVRFVPERVIRIDGIHPVVLQRVRPQLRHKTDTAALLKFVDHEAAAFIGDGVHGEVDLVPAVAAQRPEHFAREALRVDAQQRRTVLHVAHRQREGRFGPRLAVRDVALEGCRLK